MFCFSVQEQQKQIQKEDLSLPIVKVFLQSSKVLVIYDIKVASVQNFKNKFFVLVTSRKYGKDSASHLLK